MPNEIEITINGGQVRVERGTTVAAAILQAGITSFFHSPSGEPRAPLCGMGVCYGCMVTINGETGVLACQTVCAKGMKVVTE
ncbi:MAG TPA: (2Fe-2S)-binding protein [Bryobacteraceae bacterium]|nr:(2Fe-2S)-binding protein [Bryobacteraceae bacterium]HPT24792.1 (2Fe-2S)-binding protein [Bryobacteraceae bacterium]